jgi:Fe-S cluster biosynthesis and repair protein YggX
MNDDMIEQYRKMAKANPDDDLAHFALGQALLNAQRFAEAAPVLRHVTRINPQYTRAFLLLGEALDADEDEDAAIEAWQLGYQAAVKKGELMVAQSSKKYLEQKGAPLTSDVVELLTIEDPANAEVIDDREAEEGEVRCIRSGKIGAQMKFNPFDNVVGDFILAHVSQESWEDWMEMSIKVINELRLDLGDLEGQKIYDQHMQDYLNLPNDLLDTK